MERQLPLYRYIGVKFIIGYMVRAILKGRVGTAIEVLLSTMKEIGDCVDFHNITKMVPSGTDYTKFLYQCIDFCNDNGGAKDYRIESIERNGGETKLTVCPMAIASGDR